MSRSVTVTVSHVDVDVDLCDIDTEDLISELLDRDVNLSDYHGGRDQLEDLYVAFKTGRVDRAMELARQLAQNYKNVATL